MTHFDTETENTGVGRASPRDRSYIADLEKILKRKIIHRDISHSLARSTYTTDCHFMLCQYMRHRIHELSPRINLQQF